MTSSPRTRSFGLIGAGFAIAGIVSACGGASGTASPATTQPTASFTAPLAAQSSGPVVATAPAHPLPAVTSSPATTTAAATTSSTGTAPTSLVPTSAQATTAGATTTKPAGRTTSKSAAPKTSMSMSMSPTPTRTSAKPTSKSPSPAPTTTKPVSKSPTPTTTPPPAAVTVTAVETEFAIALSRTSFSPGTVTFVAENKGTTTHALGISGPGVDKATGDLDAGGSARLTVTLAKGSYDVYCPVGNHKMLGMDVHITVS